MKIVLFGYGKMGQTIEKLALERGHDIIGVVDIDTTEKEKSQLLQDADAVIEFTQPSSVLSNIHFCLGRNTPLVVGTTGWHDKLAEITANLPVGGRLFHASNFSIGVNLFFAANEYLAKLLNDYDNFEVTMKEIHHIHKKDQPSGTAITAAEGIIRHMNRKKHWTLEKSSNAKEIYIEAQREGEVFGYHEVNYKSSLDTIKLSHDAHGREGFAHGAISAAEWLTQQDEGVYTMKNMLNIL